MKIKAINLIEAFDNQAGFVLVHKTIRILFHLKHPLATNAEKEETLNPKYDFEEESFILDAWQEPNLSASELEKCKTK